MNLTTHNYLDRVKNMDMLKFIQLSGMEQIKNEGCELLFRNPKNKDEFRYHQIFGLLDFPSRQDVVSDNISYAEKVLGIDVPQLLTFIKHHFPEIPDVPHITPAEMNRSSEARQVMELPLDYLNLVCDGKLKNFDSQLIEEVLKPVLFELNGKLETGYAVTNDAGGMELYYKSNELFNQTAFFGPGDAMTVKKDSKNLDVFDSPCDYLALNTLRKNFGVPDPGNSSLIIYDHKLFEHKREFMEQHRQVNLYLPNLGISEQIKGYATWLNPKIYFDRSNVFKHSQSLKDHFEKNVLQQRRGHRKSNSKSI